MTRWPPGRNIVAVGASGKTAMQLNQGDRFVGDAAQPKCLLAQTSKASDADEAFEHTIGIFVR